MKTFRLKVKPEAYAWLNAAAREVNTVWNWANETSEKAIRRYTGAPKWLSGYELQKLTSGSSKLFRRINSDTIGRVCQEYALKRRAARKVRLRWRKSGGSRKSLGWVPFKGEYVRKHGKSFRYVGKTFRLFNDTYLPSGKMGCGCFAQDACGDWWLCVPMDSEASDIPAPIESVGIDLGLKALATMSDGQTSPSVDLYRGSEAKIGQAQRRAHLRQAKLFNRKVKRQRQDALHKLSRLIVDKYQNIFVGDVSSSRLKLTRMSKSVNDAGWFMLKTQLQQKGQQAGRRVEIVNEAYTTKACSSCGLLSGPSGLRQLSVRQWTCECGVTHDRDVNAARNILTVGLRQQPPFAGTNTAKRMAAGRRTARSARTPILEKPI